MVEGVGGGFQGSLRSVAVEDEACKYTLGSIQRYSARLLYLLDSCCFQKCKGTLVDISQMGLVSVYLVVSLYRS